MKHKGQFGVIKDRFPLDEDGPTTIRFQFSLAYGPAHTQVGMEVRLYYGKEILYDINTDSFYNIDAGWGVKIPAEAIAEEASGRDVCWDS